MSLKYHLIKVLESNYVVILEDSEKNALIVDPGSFKEVDEFVKTNGLNVKQVVITHTHADHIAGLKDCIKAYNPEVFAPLDDIFESQNYNFVKNGSVINLLGFKTNVYISAYHKNPHAFFNIESLKMLFVGDLVFAYGAGRSFGTDIKHLKQAINTIKTFDDNTLIFAGHEYGLQNLCFLQQNGFENSFIKNLILELKANKEPCTVPFTLKSQKQHNAFFFYNNEDALKKLNTNDSLKYLQKLRAMRDAFNKL